MLCCCLRCFASPCVPTSRPFLTRTLASTPSAPIAGQSARPACRRSSPAATLARNAPSWLPPAPFPAAGAAAAAAAAVEDASDAGTGLCAPGGAEAGRRLLPPLLTCMPPGPRRRCSGMGATGSAEDADAIAAARAASAACLACRSMSRSSKVPACELAAATDANSGHSSQAVSTGVSSCCCF